MMTVLNTPSWIVALISGLLVFSFEFFINKILNENKKSNAQNIGKAVFIGGLTLLFSLTLENVQKLENIEKELVGVNQKATAFDFFKPYETIQHLEDNCAFQRLLKFQMEQIRDRLKQIEKGELNLSREEVIPIWEALISKYTSNEIKATNVVSINDWEKFSPNEGLEAHEEFFIKKNTKFKRLFIYDLKDSLSVKGTFELAKKQFELSRKLSLGKDRLQIKMINKNRIDNTTYGSTMYSSFGTLDIVIFDKDCLLQTITQYKNNSYEIVNGVVTNNKSKIIFADEMFDKLWDKAENMDEFKMNIKELCRK